MFFALSALEDHAGSAGAMVNSAELHADEHGRASQMEFQWEEDQNRKHAREHAPNEEGKFCMDGFAGPLNDCPGFAHTVEDGH